jgi:hypothetical protein
VGSPKRALIGFAVGIAAVAVAACGSEEERQDADEPSGRFQVEVTKSQFANRQRLAQTTDLILGVRNVDSEQVPNLAITVFTDSGEADESFSIRDNQPGLADPNRPVWVLENKYPRLVGEPPPKGVSIAETAATNTYLFGPLEPGEGKQIVWRVTPVQGGTYTLNYEVAAGLHGKAQAVTSDGSDPAGEFVVTISTKPPKARVNDAGEVEIQE